MSVLLSIVFSLAWLFLSLYSTTISRYRTRELSKDMQFVCRWVDFMAIVYLGAIVYLKILT